MEEIFLAFNTGISKDEFLASPPALWPHHEERLRNRFISSELWWGDWGVRYRSTTMYEAMALGFKRYQCPSDGLLIYLFGVDGRPISFQFRPDEPRLRDGKPVKYESMPKRPPILDSHPLALKNLPAIQIPLYITEGCAKADSMLSRWGKCCLCLQGVWSWRGRNPYRGLTALADWNMVPVNDGRIVRLAFDGDVADKPGVRAALRQLSGWLQFKGADVRVINFNKASEALFNGN
jgi:hypothetical protein